MLPVQIQSILLALLTLVANAYSVGVSNPPAQQPAPTPLPAAVEHQLDTVPAFNDHALAGSLYEGDEDTRAVAPAEPVSPTKAEKPPKAAGETLLVVPVARPEAISEVNTEALSREALEYLSEIGFGAEYGASSPVLHKWREDVRIKVHGKPSEADIATLQQVVAELDDLIPQLKVRITDGAPNVDIHFLPESDFTSVDPNYVPVNLGFFRVWWDGDEVIYKGRILISTEGISQRERSHLIREELTQTFGLFRDSWQHQDSIFYQGWTATVEYSPLDREVIRLLYSSQLEPGMGRDQVRSTFAAD